VQLRLRAQGGLQGSRPHSWACSTLFCALKGPGSSFDCTSGRHITAGVQAMRVRKRMSPKRPECKLATGLATPSCMPFWQTHHRWGADNACTSACLQRDLRAKAGKRLSHALVHAI